VKKNYQRKERKSNRKFEVVRGQELLVRVPLPMAEVWAEMQAQVEELTGQAGLQILRAILENEVTRRVGPPHRSLAWVPFLRRWDAPEDTGIFPRRRRHSRTPSSTINWYLGSDATSACPVAEP
jgi:hypothetical protein